MLHFLTIGFLDESAVRVGQARATKPLSAEVLALLAQFADSPVGAPTFEGGEVRLRSDYVRCQLWAPAFNRPQ